jgi:hypothetical protein
MLAMLISTLVIFMTFIFVIEIGLGWLDGSKLFYNGAETSRIALVYDVFIKSSQELICDT